MYDEPGESESREPWESEERKPWESDGDLPWGGTTDESWRGTTPAFEADCSTEDSSESWRGESHTADWPENMAGPEYWLYKRMDEE